MCVLSASPESQSHGWHAILYDIPASPCKTQLHLYRCMGRSHAADHDSEEVGPP